jgi:lysophospholipase L1-like esterase
MNRRLLLAFGGAFAAPWFLPGCSRRDAAKLAPLPAGAAVLALGDSLTAGQGAHAQESWPSVLAELSGWQVHNAGLNGDTTADGLQRLPPLLAERQWDAILIGLGGNDMLRGLSEAQTRSQLLELVLLAKSHTAYTALIATPQPSAGAALIGRLKDADFYRSAADEAGVLLIESAYAVVLSNEAQRSDRIHANAAGYRAIAHDLDSQLQRRGWR